MYILSSVIPLEIRRLGESVVQRYLQLLRKGKKKKMPRCNLIALGEERVGKTSLLSLLMGKDFIENRASTCGIDNEHVEVLESRAVCSEMWTEVKSEDIARGNEKQFANSVAEEVRPHLVGTGLPKTTSPPTPKALAASLTKIDQYLKELEEKAKQAPAPAPVGTPALQIGTLAIARAVAAKVSITAPVYQAVTTHHRIEPHTEHRTATPRTLAAPPTDVAKPKTVKQPEKEIKPRPDHSRPDPISDPAEPPTRHSQNTRRQPNVGLRLKKSIVTTAKQGVDAMEPVLQYNTLDFAGQKEYRAMHHCFIVRRAIYLVVFNLQVLRGSLCSEHRRKQALEEILYWLNSIHAHIYDSDRSHKTVLLVGTHRAPNGVAPLTDEDLLSIDEAFIDEFARHRSIQNNVYRADPSGKFWFAAVENSMDGCEESDRKGSGASSLQEAIHCAWNNLPFKKEEYPTTWLRFEAFLNDIRTRETPIVNAETIRQTAREEYGIGEENKEDVELALGFFHDTGTIVYPSKYSMLYIHTFP